MKTATVQLTIEWEITEKGWLEELEHLKSMKGHPSIVVSDDVIHTLFALNDVAYPKVIRTKIK